MTQAMLLGKRVTPAIAVRALVVNFNGPELNYLALALAQHDQLAAFVRPYINKGRLWEKVLGKLPLAGGLYQQTFGRRRIDDPQLIRLTREAGVTADLLGTAIARAPWLQEHLRQSLTHSFQERVRHAVAARGAQLSDTANCVIAYQGFALQAFRANQALRQPKTILNYPIAHHRQHREMWAEEAELEPDFASTWLGFDHWADGYEAQLDEEIDCADAILVGSNYARHSFLAQGVPPQKLKTIPYGVDLDIFFPAQAQKSPTTFDVVYAGQLTQRKGISYLLKGYKKFQRPDSSLTLIGALVGGSAPFLGYRDVFRHVPHLTRPLLAERYRQASVFVFPTLLEGMGLVVLEAMACGLPVIVTDHGPGDLVREGIDGFIVPIRDEDAICERLQRLYDNPELRIAMGRNARQRAIQFGWQAYTANVSAYLAQLVDQPAPCHAV